MILKIIMAIVVPISLILLMSLITNSVFILVDLPVSIENGQTLARRFFNETNSGEYSYNKVISKLMIPALRDLFVAQGLLSQHITDFQVKDEHFQYYSTNMTNDQDALILHFKSYNRLIRSNVTVFCENGVFVAYGRQNIEDYYESWYSKVKNCSTNQCFVLNEYQKDWIKPEILDFYMQFSILVTVLDNYKCLISQRQNIQDFVDLAKSWNSNIYRGLVVNQILYEVNSTTDKFYISNLTELSRTYPNQTASWIDELYDELNDCGYQFNTFEYVGADNIPLICRSTLFFVNNPELDCPKASIDIKKQFSILFLETFTVEFRNSEVGILESDMNLSEYIAFLFLVKLIIFIYTWRQGVKVSLSFVIPLRIISAKILDQSVQELSQQNFSPQYYEQYRNSEDVRQFLDATINYANSVKYQSNEFELNAEGLMMMSNSKKFFKKQNNLTAVGICSNNIARIHVENKRYLEALNEQEESIQIAEQELQSLQQLDEFHRKLSTSKNWSQVYDSFKKRLLSKFVGEDRIFERLQSQNLQPQLSKMISMEFKQRSNTMQINKRSSNVVSRMNGDRPKHSPNNFSGLNNNITSIALLQQAEKSNQSLPKEDSVIEEDSRLVVKLKLLNRKYQLLQILSQFSNQHDQLFLNEILMLLLQMKTEAEEQKPQSSFLINFRLNVTCQLVHFYTKANKIKEAKKLLKGISLRSLIPNGELCSSINIFSDSPQLLISSKFSLLRAVIDLRMNKISSSCEKLLSILTMSMYDPVQYNYAFNLLTSIFKSYKLDTFYLEQFRLCQQHFEAIILIDYTNQITMEQIKIAHSTAKYILSQMNNNDQVGLYAINSTFHQIFPLQNYQPFLENSLNQLLLPPGGESQLLSLLQIAAGQFFQKNKPKENEDSYHNSSIKSINFKSTPHSLSNAGDILDKCLQTDYHDQIHDEEVNDSALRIIILFAELVSDFKQKNLEILKQILFKRKIHLVVIQIANQNIDKIYLEKLSQLTSESCLLKPNQVFQYFQQIRPKPYIKRQYLEFF